jgi:CRP/FNR family transcriptional regulator, cyclic AMP receptor protein
MQEMKYTEEIFRKYGRIYDEGKVIFREGEPGNEMFIIIEGKVKITKSAGNLEKTLMILGNGDFFGEMALVDDKPRSASAIALTTCKLIALDKNTFKSVILNNPSFAYKVILKMSERLREADKQIEELLKYDKRTRIIKSIAEAFEQKEYSKLSDLVKDVSDLVGVSESEVLSVIRELVNSSVIGLKAGKITINKEELKRIYKFLYFSKPHYEAD